MTQKLLSCTEDNTKLKQSLSKAKFGKDNSDQTIAHLDTIDKLSVKVDQLTKDNLEKEHQWNQLIKELEQSHDHNKACEQSHKEALANYISKFDHKNAIQKQHQENQIVVKEVSFVAVYILFSHSIQIFVAAPDNQKT